MAQGVDPGFFSKGMMHGAKRAFEQMRVLDPVHLICFGHNQVDNVTGSSTALIAVFTEEGHSLKVANIGDSRLCVFRNGAIVHQTREMQHSFNFPVQLGTGHSTRATDADVYSFGEQLPLIVVQFPNPPFLKALEEGDVIVTSTDGLFDNLYSEEISEIVAKTESKVIKTEAFR